MENKELIVQDELSNEEIKRLIYTIRGKQVMLDSDVAVLYQYETRKINQAVKRNLNRFPEDFCFQLTEEEFRALKTQFNFVNNNVAEKNSLRSQIVILEENLSKGKHRKYLPYVFTEQGIAMLAGILKSEIAINVSVSIIRAFIEMRNFLSSNGNIFERLTNIEYKLQNYDKKFNEIFNLLQIEDNIKQRIFFEGQIYDAYSLIIDIIKKANEKILIIDNYVDDSILKMLTKKKKDVEVMILTSGKSTIRKIDVQKFNQEYPILRVAKTSKYHDRFIILDNKEMYHIGASIKDLGKKCFGINRIEDIEIMQKMIDLLCI